jgi:cell division septum initiation protein DivIVA
MKSQKELATKAAYATLGAPVVITRQVREISSKQLKELSEKLAGLSDKLTGNAKGMVDDYASEGEKVAKQIRGTTVVEELQQRVDLDKVSARAEKLRDQLEAAMQSWRESFNPGEAKEAAKKVVVEAETEAEETPAKATATKPATRKPAAKPSTSKAGTTAK